MQVAVHGQQQADHAAPLESLAIDVVRRVQNPCEQSASQNVDSERFLIRHGAMPTCGPRACVAADQNPEVSEYLAGMEQARRALTGLVELFDHEAVYVESAPEQHPRGVVLTLDGLDLDGQRLRSERTCRLTVRTAPMREFDLLTLRAGRLAPLETTGAEFPRA